MKDITKLIVLSLIGVCLVYDINAQDAGNFSSTAIQLINTFPGGSARIRGLGGAQTALGGDITSISSNPAGLGFFNRSEFSFSPTFNYILSGSDYLGQNTEDSKLNFNIGNLALVVNGTKGDLVESKWRGGNFGVSINRIADFQNQMTYEGNTFIEIFPDPPVDFLEFATTNTELDANDNPVFLNDLAELAFSIGLIDTFTVNNQVIVDRNIYADDGNGNLIPAFPTQEFPTLQTETINVKGGSYQTSVSYGGNYDDKLFFGVSIGFISTNKEVERIFIERPTDTDLNNLTLIDKHEITGVGVNGTFGLIVRPVLPLLLGLSYTTPSFHSLEQTQEVTLSASFTDGEFFDNTFVYLPFQYNITTPSRANVGLTYFVGKHGFITGDLERVNYGGAKLSGASDGFSFSNSNREINTFAAVNNYRVGAEYRYEMFRLRGGFAHLEDPTNDGIDNTRQQLTFGAGVRTQEFYVDLGVINDLNNKSVVSPYPGANPAIVSTDKTKITFSVGFFF